MKRILPHLAISILAFGLGLSVSALWRFYTSVNTPQLLLAYTSEELPFPLLTREEIEVVFGPISRTYLHHYYLSNGGDVTHACYSFSSAAAASKEVQARRRGSDTIELSLNIDSEGQPVGETVLILESPRVVRLSTNLERLCATNASSLDDLRWFDNQGFH